MITFLNIKVLEDKVLRRDENRIVAKKQMPADQLTFGSKKFTFK